MDQHCGMQGRIHPRLHRKFLSLDLSCHEIRAAESAYAFSPQEIHQGARTLGLSLHDFLAALKELAYDALGDG
jgi:FO synthase